MHFIEQLFAFSPDGGSALTEVIVLASFAACVFLRSVFLRARTFREKLTRATPIR
jgi:hypothetical protein